MEQPTVLRFAHPLPYGAIVHDGGVQFVVFSRRATAMRVLLYDKVTDREPEQIIDFDPDLNRWGDIWSIFVPGVGPGQLYHFQADGPHEPEKGNRFDPKARLIDPYAKALAGEFLPATDGIIRPPKCVVIDDEFDWQGDRHLRRSLPETIIYEMHVRGFTKSRSSEVEHPGTYKGIIEKIPYLQSLGVTAIELMPVHEFSSIDCFGNKPERSNYWGYDPMAFFAPHRGYATSSEPGCQVREFKEMVRALHQAGIEVILDVVFNHTAEGNEWGPTLSFKGLENRVYYMLENGGRTYRNYTGCGNTLNGNHPIVRELIFHCLRYWVHNYHVDGFRFDLASILSRDRNGESAAQSAGGRIDRRGSPAGRHEDHRRSLGRRRRVSGGHVRQPALGRMERPLPRRRAPLLARRRASAGRDGHAAGRFERFVSSPAGGGRITASISSPRTTASRSTIWSATTTSTTRPTAKATATATTTTTATTTAWKARPAGRRSRASACGRSRTCSPRFTSARACR